MARATASRSSDSPKDAIALLKNDHRTVEQLLDEFESAEDEQLAPLAERICQLLTIHAQIEEELLYPQARTAFEEEEQEEEIELVEEAAVEHATAKDLIARIEGMTADDHAFKATVKVLGEYVKHHVKEEEQEIFPKLRRAGLDLKEMGAELADRKHSLMEQMGVSEEEAAPPRRKRAQTPSKAAPRAAPRAASRSRAGRKPSARAGAGARRTSRGHNGRAARH